MKEAVHEIQIGDWRWEYRYPEVMVPGFVFFLRIAFGFYFLWSGIDKALNDFTSSGFLVNASQGPLSDLFVDLGEESTAVDIIDPLVFGGQILIGIALILGLFTRFALSMAALQMFLFYLPVLWPEHNPFLDELREGNRPGRYSRALGAGPAYSWQPVRIGLSGPALRPRPGVA